MKSQRRHQLQQNALADALGTGLERATPWLKPLLAAVIIAVLGVSIYLLYKSQTESYQASAAGQLLLATGQEDPGTYETIAAQYPDTAAGRWALVAEGDLHLAQGIDALYVDRSEAEMLLENAIESYRAALTDASETMLISHAHYGLAQALEASGELEEAAEHYEQVAEVTDSEVLKETALQRAEHVRSSEAKEFYAWLASAAGTGGAAFPGGQAPGVGSPGAGLPGVPDIQLPDLTGLQAPENAAAPIEQPAAEVTTEEPAGEATEQPAAETAEAPAGDDAAAEATEQPAADDEPGEADPEATPTVEEQPVGGDQDATDERGANAGDAAGEQDAAADDQTESPADE